MHRNCYDAAVDVRDGLAVVHNTRALAVARLQRGGEHDQDPRELNRDVMWAM